ncbi:nuclear transport factor 2 family protein [Microbispora triticiradicis]|uniref:Nuclear transport factor 2 family protein n=1 Tax=Microbispora triticiradicis TaxID=2200763 RepID=A0ABX9LEK6_9ACTN|nr:nuclear transport factor 2 family protein [Microbispora triticiradicis]RGA02392.1 nuclear transport factor 2 family protein [Microbispora triticiradicis]GLW25406.1 ketosteroid isomerase [Microbispora amethystogenes]
MSAQSEKAQAENNARVVRGFYDALSGGDLEAAGAFLTDDSVLHVPGKSTNTGDYAGREAVIGFVLKAATLSQGTLKLDVHRVLADDEAAVALATYTATRPDREVPLENNLAHVITMRDGRIAESWLHSRDQYEVDAFWGE